MYTYIEICRKNIDMIFDILNGLFDEISQCLSFNQFNRIRLIYLKYSFCFCSYSLCPILTSFVKSILCVSDGDDIATNLTNFNLFVR